MSESFDEINKVLDSGSKQEKIKILDSLNDTSDPKIINKIITLLDDPEIEVRGEVFSGILSPMSITALIALFFTSKLLSERQL